MNRVPAFLRAVFKHSWVSSYQIGFGPPLIRATERLTNRVRGAGSVLEKLEIYLEHCFLDSDERARLAKLQRTLTIRRHGPIEAETLDRADREALDLLLRLHVPSKAPEEVKAEMKRVGVDFGSVPNDAAPDLLNGRFVLHLSDPTNDRLMHVQEVKDLAADDDAVAVELRSSGAFVQLWTEFTKLVAESAGAKVVSITDPVPHARVTRNGATG